MSIRTLNDGTKLYRNKSPLGVGHQYFIGSPESGWILVADTVLTPPRLLSEVVAWELDIEETTQPKLEFNKK